MGGYAWVTLATNDSYSLGALVLAHSLKKFNTSHRLVVLITPAVSQPLREHLQNVFDVVKVVDVLDSKDAAHLALIKRPELGITFTKIHCWNLVEFEKCVFLDADTLVVRNCDELFEREEFSAAPDICWPDCFNSGVFVYRPSVETFNKLLKFAEEKGSFDGADQGLLNQFFCDWATEDIKKHLPFVYNMTSMAAYSYIPAFKHYASETRIVHFIGTGKPWLQQLDPATRTVIPSPGSEHLTPLLQQWWDLFCEKVHPNLEKNLESTNGMSQIEECSNSVVAVELTEELPVDCWLEPCTTYREKDDFRQHNLPYQPFNVEGMSGELLNVEFLLASVSTPSTTLEVSEPEQPSRVLEQVVEEKARTSDTGEREGEDYEDSDVKEVTTAEVEQELQEVVPCPKGPFDYDSFFPDDTCVKNYLDQNVVHYKPFKNEAKQAPFVETPPLPRFLTIPESDQRQSGNIVNYSKQDCETQMGDNSLPSREVQSSPQTQDSVHQNSCSPQLTQVDSEHNCQEETPQSSEFNHLGSKQCDPLNYCQHDRHSKQLERGDFQKSKSMSNLLFDVTTMDTPPTRSVWKSQPDVNNETNRKFSMPKLKPILPKQNSFSKSLPKTIPKVTVYTELLMSSEYKDPVDWPADKTGFVDTQLRKTDSDVSTKSKFGPLPYSPLKMMTPTSPQRPPLSPLDLNTGLYDLTYCKRQLGNKPKPKDHLLEGVKKKKSKELFPIQGEEEKVVKMSKENRRALSAPKPFVPKDKLPVAVKKRKSKELSPIQGEKEKVAKMSKEIPKGKRDRKKAASASANVDDILKRLKEFTKNYQHYFGEVNFCHAGTPTSTHFTTKSAVNNCERETNLEFRQFRNYVKDQKEATERGLISIQDILSESGKTESGKAEKDGVVVLSKERRLRNASGVTDSQDGHQAREERCHGLRRSAVVTAAAAINGDGPTPARGEYSEAFRSRGEEDKMKKTLIEVVNGDEKTVDGKVPLLPTESRHHTFCHKLAPKVDESGASKNHEQASSLNSETNAPVGAVHYLNGKTKVKKNKQEKTLLKSNIYDELLCVPQFETPRSSRTSPTTPETAVSEIVEELIAKSTLRGSQQSKKSVVESPEKPKRSGVPSSGESGEARPSLPPSTPRNGHEDAGAAALEDGSTRSGIAGAIAQLSLEAASSTGQESPATNQEYLRRLNWETGNIDYMGKDSFDNIWAKICETLEGKDLGEEEALTAATSDHRSNETSVTTTRVFEDEDLKPPEAESPSPQTCSDSRDGLPPVASPEHLEDEEILSLKPKDTQACMTKVPEKEESGSVKLSDILGPERGEKADSQPEKVTPVVPGSAEDDGTHKKGVFSKLLEIVGVTPKGKKDDSNSVFYDVDPEPPAQESLEEVAKKDEVEGAAADEPKQPSPKLKLAPSPETAITVPTPPPLCEVSTSDVLNPTLLKVDDTILQTPPVVEPVVQGKVVSEIDEILKKAKAEAENRLQDQNTMVEKEKEASELINAVKLVAGVEEQPLRLESKPELEELKVTPEEERKKRKGEAGSSKLSDQILKAIPPPRRKAISEAASSSEEKPARASAIPVAPPRNRSKATQAASPKGKTKK